MKLLKTILIFFLAVFFLAGVLYLGRNQILNKYISDYLKNEFNEISGVEQTYISLNGIKLGGVNIENDYFSFNAEEAGVLFYFPELLRPKVIDLKLEEAYLNIKDFDGFLSSLKSKIPVSVPEKNKGSFGLKKALGVSLSNVKVDIEGHKGLVFLSSSFSFKGKIKGERISKIDDFVIDNCKIQEGKKSVEFNLKELDQKNKYLLNIPKIRIKRRTIEDMRIPLEIDENNAEIKAIKTDFFGEEAEIKGNIDYSDYSLICAEAKFNNTSFKRLKQLLADKGDFSFSGFFNGSVKACASEFKLSDVSGELYNNTGGYINVRKKDAFGFLKKRMPLSSYETLMESLKNYKYDTGKIKISSQEEKVLVLDMNFSSPVLGERNLTVHFHDVMNFTEITK